MTPRRNRSCGTAGRAGGALARLLLSSLMALLATLALAPIAMAAPVTYQPGSLIVPMDATYQNFGMFKSYGLVYRLLQNGVPVTVNNEVQPSNDPNPQPRER